MADVDTIKLTNTSDENDNFEISYMPEHIFFSSDEHLTHANILRYTYRDYNDIDAMAEDYVARHNAVVPERNSVWIDLGDFVFAMRWKKANSKSGILKRYVRRMNGEVKILVCGNHDHMAMEEYEKAGFDKVFAKGSVVDMKLPDGKVIALSHRPPLLNPDDRLNPHGCAELERKDEFLSLDITNKENVLPDNIAICKPWICGHVHQMFRHYANGPLINAGVDVWDGYPVSLERILRELGGAE
jgi:calcineurin-like phosphoesterase family protein